MSIEGYVRADKKRFAIACEPFFLCLFRGFDFRCLTGTTSHIIELRPSNRALTDHFDALDLRRMKHKGLFDAHAVGDLSDRKGLAKTAVFTRDHKTLERLGLNLFLNGLIRTGVLGFIRIRSAAGDLFELDMDFDRITDAERRHFRFHRLFFNRFNYVTH